MSCFFAENGRQPWVVEGMLLTFLGSSTLTAGNLITSLAEFAFLFYTALAVVKIYLMLKYINQTSIKKRNLQHD
ncbi:cytochrome ubiquinol oxidase subunit I [Coxiella endosymbiont of Ornithodoros amblus]|uniref:cytochrome ubiquinol oxidase subunit I n=1 Tax=Coxiella endosymbiont of Ornithodoros amblus TaxID=1656166 RepID=UPI003CC749B1